MSAGAATGAALALAIALAIAALTWLASDPATTGALRRLRRSWWRD